MVFTPALTFTTEDYAHPYQKASSDEIKNMPHRKLKFQNLTLDNLPSMARSETEFGSVFRIYQKYLPLNASEHPPLLYVQRFISSVFNFGNIDITLETAPGIKEEAGHVLKVMKSINAHAIENAADNYTKIQPILDMHQHLLTSLIAFLGEEYFTESIDEVDDHNTTMESTSVDVEVSPTDESTIPPGQGRPPASPGSADDEVDASGHNTTMDSTSGISPTDGSTIPPGQGDPPISADSPNDEATEEEHVVVNLEDVVLDTDTYKNVEFQVEERLSQEARSAANRVRDNVLKRLKYELKGNRLTCIVVSKMLERQSPSQMRDNAWASLLLYGVDNSSFIVGCCDNPYTALVTFKERDVMTKLVQHKTIPYRRLMADGSSFEVGELQIIDPQVDREEFIVTGADDTNCLQAANALRHELLRRYADLSVDTKRSKITKKIKVAGTVQELQVETSDFIMSITSPADKTYAYPRGAFPVRLENGRQIRLFIAPRGYDSLCKHCGEDQNSGCRRIVEFPEGPKMMWACKSQCYSCERPLDLDHDEAECLRRRGHSKKEVDVAKTKNAAIRQCSEYFAYKPVSLEEALTPDYSPLKKVEECKKGGMGGLKSTWADIVSSSTAAASSGSSPYASSFAERGAKRKQAFVELNKQCLEKQAQTGRTVTGSVRMFNIMDEQKVDPSTGNLVTEKVKKYYHAGSRKYGNNGSNAKSKSMNKQVNDANILLKPGGGAAMDLTYSRKRATRNSGSESSVEVAGEKQHIEEDGTITSNTA